MADETIAGFTAGGNDALFNIMREEVINRKRIEAENVQFYRRNSLAPIDLPRDISGRVAYQPRYTEGTRDPRAAQYDYISRLDIEQSNKAQAASSALISMGGFMVGNKIGAGASSMLGLKGPAAFMAGSLAVPALVAAGVSEIAKPGIKKAYERDIYGKAEARDIMSRRKEIGLTNEDMNYDRFMDGGRKVRSVIEEKDDLFSNDESARIHKIGLESRLLSARKPGSMDSGSLKQYSKNFKDLKDTTEEVVKFMGTTIEGAMSVISELKKAGVGNLSQIRNEIRIAKALGTASGVGAENIMRIGAAGAQAVQGTGYDANSGMNVYQHAAGSLGAMSMGNRKMGAAIQQAGGIEAASNMLGNATFNALNSGVGKTFMLGMMDRDGNIDKDKLKRLQSGDVISYEAIGMAGNAGYGLKSKVLFDKNSYRNANQLMQTGNMANEMLEAMYKTWGSQHVYNTEDEKRWAFSKYVSGNDVRSAGLVDQYLASDKKKWIAPAAMKSQEMFLQNSDYKEVKSGFERFGDDIKAAVSPIGEAMYDGVWKNGIRKTWRDGVGGIAKTFRDANDRFGKYYDKMTLGIVSNSFYKADVGDIGKGLDKMMGVGESSSMSGEEWSKYEDSRAKRNGYDEELSYGALGTMRTSKEYQDAFNSWDGKSNNQYKSATASEIESYTSGTDARVDISDDALKAFLKNDVKAIKNGYTRIAAASYNGKIEGIQKDHQLQGLFGSDFKTGEEMATYAKSLHDVITDEKKLQKRAASFSKPEQTYDSYIAAMTKSGGIKVPDKQPKKKKGWFASLGDELNSGIEEAPVSLGNIFTRTEWDELKESSKYYGEKNVVYASDSPEGGFAGSVLKEAGRRGEKIAYKNGKMYINDSGLTKAGKEITRNSISGKTDLNTAYKLKGDETFRDLRISDSGSGSDIMKNEKLPEIFLSDIRNISGHVAKYDPSKSERDAKYKATEKGVSRVGAALPTGVGYGSMQSAAMPSSFKAPEQVTTKDKDIARIHAEALARVIKQSGGGDFNPSTTKGVVGMAVYASDNKESLTSNVFKYLNEKAGSKFIGYDGLEHDTESGAKYGLGDFVNKMVDNLAETGGAYNYSEEKKKAETYAKSKQSTIVQASVRGGIITTEEGTMIMEGVNASFMDATKENRDKVKKAINSAAYKKMTLASGVTEEQFGEDLKKANDQLTGKTTKSAGTEAPIHSRVEELYSRPSVPKVNMDFDQGSVDYGNDTNKGWSVTGKAEQKVHETIKSPSKNLTPRQAMVEQTHFLYNNPQIATEIMNAKVAAAGGNYQRALQIVNQKRAEKNSGYSEEVGAAYLSIWEGGKNSTVNPDVMAGQIQTENQWKAKGRSKANAVGAFQITEETWRGYIRNGFEFNGRKLTMADIYNNKAQAQVAADVQRTFIDYNKGNIVMGVAGYNGGYKITTKDNDESMNYVAKVFEFVGVNGLVTRDTDKNSLVRSRNFEAFTESQKMFGGAETKEFYDMASSLGNEDVNGLVYQIQKLIQDSPTGKLTKDNTGRQYFDKDNNGKLDDGDTTEVTVNDKTYSLNNALELINLQSNNKNFNQSALGTEGISTQITPRTMNLWNNQWR